MQKPNVCYNLIAIYQTWECVFIRLIIHIREPLYGWFYVLIGILYKIINHFLKTENIEWLRWCLDSLCKSAWSWSMFPYVFGSTLLQFGVFRVGAPFDLHSFFYILTSKNFFRLASHVQIITFVHNLIKILEFLFFCWFFWYILRFIILVILFLVVFLTSLLVGASSGITSLL